MLLSEQRGSLWERSPRLLVEHVVPLTSPFSLCQIPGGFSEDSCVLRGIMVNKDVTHPRMRRLIKNPRIVLLDCSLEYKKGESQVSAGGAEPAVVRLLLIGSRKLQCSPRDRGGGGAGSVPGCERCFSSCAD